MRKPNNCPSCNSPKPWLIRILPTRWIFTKYFVECRECHWCGKTRIGKNRAIKAWNKEVIYGERAYLFRRCQESNLKGKSVYDILLGWVEACGCRGSGAL